jgi:hypothetical protein
MFASERMKCGVVFAAFSCLFVGLAVAQEEIQNTAQRELANQSEIRVSD